jgi:rubrerythrin
MIFNDLKESNDDFCFGGYMNALPVQKKNTDIEELKAYRAIGTVSEFAELKEKATAKKPIPLDKVGEYHECPTCGSYAENNCGSAYRFCPSCGTEFDWSEGKE